MTWNCPAAWQIQTHHLKLTNKSPESQPSTERCPVYTWVQIINWTSRETLWELVCLWKTEHVCSRLPQMSSASLWFRSHFTRVGRHLLHLWQCFIVQHVDKLAPKHVGKLHKSDVINYMKFCLGIKCAASEYLRNHMCCSERPLCCLFYEAKYVGRWHHSSGLLWVHKIWKLWKIWQRTKT